MIKLTEILLEEVSTFKGLIRVEIDPDMNSSEIQDIVRSKPGVTIVKSIDSENLTDTQFVYSVKLRTTKTPSESFKELKNDLLKTPGIKIVKIGFKTIERV